MTLRLAEIRTIEVRPHGELVLGHTSGDIILDLGEPALAESWAVRLRRSALPSPAAVRSFS